MPEETEQSESVVTSPAPGPAAAGGQRTNKDSVDFVVPVNGGYQANRIWRCGDINVTAGILYFMLTAVIMITVTLAAVINLTQGRNVELWFSALTFILGVIVPNPTSHEFGKEQHAKKDGELTS
jgi:hypothetical protein